MLFVWKILGWGGRCKIDSLPLRLIRRLIAIETSRLNAKRNIVSNDEIEMKIVIGGKLIVFPYV